MLIALPFLITFSIAGISAAPWVPTKPKQRKKLVNLLDLKDGMTIYDLGCGSGTMLFEIAKRNSKVNLIGYEISLLPYLMAMTRKVFGGKKYKNVSIKFANLFKQDLSKADIVFVFLLDKCYPKLIKKFKEDLSDNVTVIVEAWPLPEINPTEVIKEPDLLSIYFYKSENFR